MKALLSRKVYPPAPNPKNDQRIHRVYKPTLYDFRLFPSCLTNLALLLVFFTFGLQGLYFLIPIMMCVTACFFVIQRKNQSPSTVVLSSQAVLCLIFVFLQIITLFATGSIRDEKTLASCQGISTTFEGTIISAKPLATGITMAEIQPRTIQCKGSLKPLSRTVTAFLPEPLPRNTQVTIRGKLVRDKGRLILKSFTLKNIEVAPISWTEKLKNRVRQTSQRQLTPDQTSLLLGLSYGDDSAMQPSVKEEFKTAGLTHLTAVSGANISIIFLIAYRLGQFVRLHRKLLIMLAFIATLCYSQFVGWEGSVTRAWCMGLVGAFALILGSGKSTLPLFSTAIIGLLLFDPELSVNFGFLLSLVATASLILLAPPLSRIIGSVAPQIIADAFSIPIAATLWTTPVLLLLSGKISTFTVIANVLAAPFVAPITVLGLLVFLSSSVPFLDPAHHILLPLARWLTQPRLNIASWIASLPHSSFDVPATVLTFNITCVSALAFTTVLLVVDRSMTRYLIGMPMNSMMRS